MIDYFLKHRVAILVIGIVITLLLGINVIFLKIDGSFTTVLPENDPDFLFNQYVEETFGSADEIIIFIRDTKSIYREPVIRLINDLSNDLMRLTLLPVIAYSIFLQLLILTGLSWIKVIH